MMRGILVAFDGSPSSNAAVAVAIRLAMRHDARLVGLGIVDTDFIQRPQAVPAGAMSYMRALDLKLLKDACQRIQAVLDDFMQTARKAGVEHDARLVEGDAREQIESAAIGGNMIVLGKSSLHSVDGELSWIPLCIEQLLRNSVRPVLLVPDRQVVGEPGRELSPIVVAFDGSIVSSRALHLFALLGLGRAGRFMCSRKTIARPGMRRPQPNTHVNSYVPTPSGASGRSGWATGRQAGRRSPYWGRRSPSMPA